MSVGLKYEEMQAAADAVAAAVEPVQKTLTDLSAAIESNVAGFGGQAAAGFGEAITAWFDVAATLGPILEGYAQSIIGVAQDAATTDGERAAATAELMSRLGGGQP